MRLTTLPTCNRRSLRKTASIRSSSVRTRSSISAIAWCSAACISREGGGGGFASNVLSNWTFAPIIEVASGRPFQIITGETHELPVLPQFRASECGFVEHARKCLRTDRTLEVRARRRCFQLPCYVDGFNGTLLSLDGDLARNAGVKPWDVFNDFRIARASIQRALQPG